MVTAAQTLTPAATGPLTWLKEFLKQELMPSPGRAALVARMTIAATLVMVLTMIFRIPYGAYGAIYALTISRENPRTTINAVKTIIMAFVFSVVYVLIGALFFLQNPNLRLLWVIGTMFLMFFSLSAMTNYTAAARFGYLLIITIPLWDRQFQTELKVEGTLWAFAAIALGSLVTVLVELVYSQANPRDDLLDPIAERLEVVEEALSSYAESRLLDEELKSQITRYAMVGTATLRRTLQRSGYAPQYREQMGAVVAFARRLVDLAANAIQLRFDYSEEDKNRIRNLVARIASIRHDLLGRRIPTRWASQSETDGLQAFPILREMEQTVSLIPEAFADPGSTPTYSTSPPTGSQPFRLFTRDAFSNPEHVKFALKGCFAGSLCYILYNLKDWQGISTAITTCFLTALSTVGSSRQKQILRITGAIVGGVVMGIGAQVFILPYLDSIGGFLLVFVVCTLVAAWFATSSPRLSYFGVQIAVAFYLINLSDFAPQTSLEPARDRIVGILLGLLMMWLVFDQLWGTSAAVEMKRTFISNLRALAQFVREPLPGKEKIWNSDPLRETINANFDKVRNLSDAVLFELGPSRQQDLALRTRIQRWQPHLRILFVTRVGLLKYRLQVPGFELPEPVRVAQVEFDNRSAEMLEGIANRLEGKANVGKDNCEGQFDRLEQTISSCCSQGPQTEFLAPIETFLTLSRSFDSVAMSVCKDF